ncbi:MAG: hypothetical protein HZA24_12620 [Nitrospirae bacterium]|nr:hypothetical protein [Nitrospirota bacterium]
METHRMPGRLARGAGCILAAALLATCGGGGSGGGGSPTVAVNVPLGTLATQIAVGAGTTEYVFTYDLPALTPAMNDVSVDLTATLNNVAVTLASPKPGERRAASPATAQLTARIGPKGTEASVCADGVPYGPYTITWNPATGTGTVDATRVGATQTTMSVVNTGGAAVCLQVTTTTAATLDIHQVAVEAEPCREAAADIAGHWAGTYSCTNAHCGDDVNQPVDLTITQNGHSATYTDGDAHYQGTVCGNVFRFDGGVPDDGFGGGYDEGGTFVLNSPDRAGKTSHWSALNGNCSGDCTDTLHRVP